MTESFGQGRRGAMSRTNNMTLPVILTTVVLTERWHRV